MSPNTDPAAPKSHEIAQPQIRRRLPQDLIRPAQLPVFPFQGLEPFPLRRTQPTPQALVPLSAPHPQP